MCMQAWRVQVGTRCVAAQERESALLGVAHFAQGGPPELRLGGGEVLQEEGIPGRKNSRCKGTEERV